MTTRSEKYRDATKAYADAKKPVSFDTETADILSFMQCAYWKPALSLLKASDKEIQIGFAEGAHSDVGYFLGNLGFFISYKKDNEMVSETFYQTKDKAFPATDFAKAFRNQNKEISFTDFIYEKLDEIADACPKK